MIHSSVQLRVVRLLSLLQSTFSNQNYVSFLSVTDTLHQGSVYQLKVKIIILMQLLFGDMVKSQHYS